MTYKEIKEMNIVEPYYFETDMEERWYNVGLINGADIGYKQGIKDTIDKACEWLNNNQKGFILTQKDIEDFRKTMEDEQ